MRVKDLLKELSELDPETEVFLHIPGGFSAPAYETTNFSIQKGFVVRDPEREHNFYTKARGNGMFVTEQAAMTVCEDGQTFLKIGAPTVHPAYRLTISGGFF